MKPEQIIAALDRTGFSLEYRTAEVFRKNGWATISNKYYLDDRSGEAREIDLIAYKTRQIDELLFYSAIIVSCKKKNENAWALVTKPADLDNKNINWYPAHTWTNDRALRYQLEQPSFGKQLLSRLSRSAPTVWRHPVRTIFAFQELAEQVVPSNKQKAKPGSTPKPNETIVKAMNDSAIFSSLSSLMKAQAYEVGRLKDRKAGRSAYIFNLLSVHEGEMFDVQYDATPQRVTQCAFHEHIAHYIIGREEQFSRINFVNFSDLEQIVGELSKAHKVAGDEVKDQWDSFYRTVLTDQQMINVFLGDFRQKIFPAVKHRLKNSQSFSPEDIKLEFDSKTDSVNIYLDVFCDKEDAQALNDDDVVGRIASSCLKQYFRYEGEFQFAIYDYPF